MKSFSWVQFAAVFVKVTLYVFKPEVVGVTVIDELELPVLHI